jgi:hypothetical protein
LIFFFFVFFELCGIWTQNLWPQSRRRRPMNQAANWFERKNLKLDDVRWHVIIKKHQKIPLKKTKFQIKFKILNKNETSGFLSLTRMFRGFQTKFPLNNWKFRRFFRTECFGCKNPKFFITVYWTIYPILSQLFRVCHKAQGKVNYLVH